MSSGMLLPAELLSRGAVGKHVATNPTGSACLLDPADYEATCHSASKQSCGIFLQPQTPPPPPPPPPTKISDSVKTKW